MADKSKEKPKLPDNPPLRTITVEFAKKREKVKELSDENGK